MFDLYHLNYYYHFLKARHRTVLRKNDPAVRSVIEDL